MANEQEQLAAPQLSSGPVSITNDPTVASILAGVTPVMPTGPNSQTDPYQVASEQMVRQRALADKLAPLLTKQDAMSRPQSTTNPEGIPKAGLSDEPWMKMQPVTGQGFGGDAKNLLTDLGRGLLRILS